MAWRTRKPLRVFARGVSLRRRVAYSLAIVRLILVPVILLGVYYLVAMFGIVDRIVSVDAKMATEAERASTDMLEAQRAERNYFLLHDPKDLQANLQALSHLGQVIDRCRTLQPGEEPALLRMEAQAKIYQQRLLETVSRMGGTRLAPAERFQEVARAYERDLNDLLRRANRQNRQQLMEELRNRVGSFDAQITATLGSDDPELRQTTQALRASSNQILQLASDLEKRSGDRVQRDHEEAQQLVTRAEWVLGIVSALTFLLSVWVSFVLPHEVVKPLVDLKGAVDHAAAGDYEIEFDVQGDAEVVQLANSVRSLIAHVREKTTDARLLRPN